MLQKNNSSIFVIGKEIDSLFWDVIPVLDADQINYDLFKLNNSVINIPSSPEVIIISYSAIKKNLKNQINIIKQQCDAEIILAGNITSKSILADAFCEKIYCYIHLPDDVKQISFATHAAIQKYRREKQYG